MREAVKITRTTSEFNQNLLSFLNSDVSITSGGANATITKDNSFKYGYLDSFKINYINTGSSDNVVFYINDNTTTVTQDGSYILSYRFFKNSITEDVNFICNVFVNGILQTENILNQNLFISSGFEDNVWQTYAQTLDLQTGDIITMTFDTYSDTSLVDIWFDGLKLELDNKNLGIPSIYSLPNNYYTNSVSNFIFVDSINDLPTAISNVITLQDNYTYFFVKSIDFLGSRLVCGQNTVILGSSSENVILSSTGLTASALISSNYSLPMRNITITSNIALNLDGDSVNTALDWNGVNFTNCATVGTIKDYSNVIFTDCALLESANLTFNGTIGSVGFNSCLINSISGQTAIILPSTLTLTRRFRVIYSAFVVLSGETGINASTSAVIPNESYILDTVSFSGGGTYLSGVTYLNNKSLFVNCSGIENSASLGQMYMINNTTNTPIATLNTFVKANGTTTANSLNQKFTHTSNKLTYVGSQTASFKIYVSGAIASSGTNDNLIVAIGKNGTVGTSSQMSVRTITGSQAVNFGTQDIYQLSTNDYIEFFLTNASTTNSLTLSDLNLIIERF
jgi:hypothetical protein